MPEVSRHPGERGCAPNPLVRNWRCVRCVPVGRKAQSGLDEASHSRAARPVAQCTRSPRILRCYRRFRPRHRIVSHRLPRRRAGPRGHPFQRILSTSVRREINHPVQLLGPMSGGPYTAHHRYVRRLPRWWGESYPLCKSLLTSAAQAGHCTSLTRGHILRERPRSRTA